jgi:hypothetical protein
MCDGRREVSSKKTKGRECIARTVMCFLSMIARPMGHAEFAVTLTSGNGKYKEEIRRPNEANLY